MLVYTCPKCGEELQFSDIATYPPIHITECPSCGWREEKRDTIEKIPYKTSDVSSQPSCGLLDNATYYEITETGQLCMVKDVYIKSDVITILTEIQQEIEENVLADDPDTTLTFLQARETCVAVIQQKISELRGTNS